MAETVRNRFGRLEVLINNAAITVDKRFEDMTREEWDRVIDVNLGGTFNCAPVF